MTTSNNASGGSSTTEEVNPVQRKHEVPPREMLLRVLRRRKHTIHGNETKIQTFQWYKKG
jgi:hypothetical protein